MKVFLKLFFPVLLFFSPIVNAEPTAVEVLQNFFKNLKTLSADFKQSVENSQLSTVELSKGKLWIERPGKFRWDYKTPYLQEIVSDGKKIWIYDADLEQVTVKTIDQTLGNTPALLLSDNKPLTDSFTINEAGQFDGLSWVELVPKDTDAGFSSIRLGFDKQQLVEMLLKDNLGQMTMLTFKQVKRNKTVDAKLFQFTPPPGADVFDTSQ